MLSDIEISRAAAIRPILSIADRAGIPAAAVEPYGHHKAKIDIGLLDSGGGGGGGAGASTKEGRLILVTAINPTPAI